jgi:hypothetical protein
MVAPESFRDHAAPADRARRRRDNPAYLKLDLYCRGLRFDDSCYVEADGGRKILRTRAAWAAGSS